MKTRRRIVQFGFLVLTLAAVFVVKGNAERWCPFGGVEALYNYAVEGNLICSLGVSNFYILAGVLICTLLLRRVFCGYMCPIGTISEWLGRLATRLGLKAVRPPAGVDGGLAVLKYAVLAVVLFITWRASELEFRAFDPCYALISRHGEDITFWAYVVAGAVVLGSLLVTMPFCRWLCPLAAVLNGFSRFGYARVRRNEETCTQCGQCSRVCPMAIPVARVREVTHARCMSCLNCVDACPALEKGAISWGPPGSPRRAWPQAVLLTVMLACIGGAVAAVYAFPIPSYEKTRGTVPAKTASVDLMVTELTCRGRATLFTERFLWRDDILALPGYLKVQAWPGPGVARVRVIYDPEQANEESIKQAIVEPYFDAVSDTWDASPFTVVGFDPLGLDDAPATSEPAR
ncbi:MAG TPA: 4Fe-4S binding protein [Phycisphaerae bacterium]|nr:4Fe-4S binding protein [Phycisphaerae bacterium]HRY66551.1 4Fe-4S binding protein [Phycisphaerae bacterium]HSA26971.1 4Fe-4S binding protein [Phycisphaerae bacterium]